MLVPERNSESDAEWTTAISGVLLLSRVGCGSSS